LVDIISHLDPSGLAELRDLLNETPSSVERTDVTLTKFVEEYVNYVRSVVSPRTCKEYQNGLKSFLSFTGDRPISSISAKDCDLYQCRLVQKNLKPSSINIYLTGLQSVFETAVRWGYITSNPFKKVRRLKVQKLPPEFMSTEQVKIFLESQPPFWRRVFTFGFLTGARVSEIVSLRWSDVDLQRAQVRFGSSSFATKNRKVRVVPLHPVLIAMFKEMKQTESGFVFAKRNGQPYDPNHVSYIFRSAIRRLGFPRELHCHSSRHTWASMLVANGVPIYTVSKLLGHSSIQMTERYAHLQPDQMHDVINRLKIAEDTAGADVQVNKQPVDYQKG
jgi:integrase